ncbi:MAG: hypothetical protein O3A46_12375 [Candidatus Poribacteria bacterium]|nr:hypothetical protein [Candidatus Poribacteria bacterium]
MRRETNETITAIAVESSESADSRKRSPDERPIVERSPDEDELSHGLSTTQRRRAYLMRLAAREPITIGDTVAAMETVRRAVADFPELVNVMASKLPSDAGQRLMLSKY